MYDKALMFQSKLVDLATGGTFDEAQYLKLRKEFMEEPTIKTLLPGFIRKYRSVDALWGYFKSVSPHWQPRRVHIWDHFSRLLDYLEENNKTPSDNVVSITLESFDPEGVHQAWQKALNVDKVILRVLLPQLGLYLRRCASAFWKMLGSHMGNETICPSSIMK